MKSRVAVAVVLLASGAFASDQTYTWSGGVVSPNDGGVAITTDGSAQITSLVATPTAGGRVTLSGDALAFAADATVTLATSGTLAIASAVTTAGKLSVVRSDDAFRRWKGTDMGGVAYRADNVVFGGTLEEWDVFSGFSGARPAESKDAHPELIDPTGIFRTMNSSGVFTASYAINDKTGRRCRDFCLSHWDQEYTYHLLVRLCEDVVTGSGTTVTNVMAYMPNAYRSYRYENRLNEDLCASGSRAEECPRRVRSNQGGGGAYGVYGNAYNDSWRGVALDRVTFCRRGAGLAQVRFAGALTLGGQLDVAVGVEAVKEVVAGETAIGQSIGGSGNFRIEPSATETGTLTYSLNAQNLMERGSSLTIGGGAGVAKIVVTADHEKCLPCAGEINVRANGELQMLTAVGIYSGYYTEKSTFRIYEGGVLRKPNVVNGGIYSNQRVEILGGTVDFEARAALYMNYVEFSGGTLSGEAPNVALSTTNSIWNVVGDTPSSISGVHMFGDDKATDEIRLFSLNVEDVTKSDLADCKMESIVYDRGATFCNCRFRKFGAGTLELTGVSHFHNAVHVDDGVIRFGASGNVGTASGDVRDFELRGGSFEAAAGTSNDLGALAVSAPATITVEAGAKLAFADSSAKTWDVGAKEIVIEGDLGSGAVRFGTDGDGLTAAQVSKLAVRKNGKLHRVMLDDQGYLRELGLIILFR